MKKILIIVFLILISANLCCAGSVYLNTDGTNNCEIETDGTLVFNGTATVWDDINLGAGQLSLPAASNPGIDEFKDSGGSDTGIETRAFAIGEKMSGSLEFLHFYKEDSDYYPHIHFQIIDAPDGATDNVKVQIIYTVTNNGSALGTTTTITKEATVSTQYAWNTFSFDALSGSGVNIGDHFLFQISRVAASSDDFAGECLIGTIGLHVECDTAGSRTTIAK